MANLTFNDPIVRTIIAQEIKNVLIDFDSNTITIRVESIDNSYFVIDIDDYTMNLYDSLGQLLMPSDWEAENPIDDEFKLLLFKYFYGRLKDIPGASAEGTITYE